MQDKNDQNDRICIRCKSFPGVQGYSYHCDKCHLVIQGNQGNPYFNPTELELNSQDIAQTEEKRKQKQTEKELKRRLFWDYEFEDKYRYQIQDMRMLRNWNGGQKNTLPFEQARLLIQEVLQLTTS